MIRFPDAWSYSNYETWALCPFKYHGRKVLKQPEPTGQALLDGRVFHDQVAKHITNLAAPAPVRPIHQRLQPVVAQLRTIEDKIVEKQWAFTKTWKPCGWFAKAPAPTWLRVILDVGIVYEDKTAHVGDWKTGKRYGTNDDQMELFALATFAQFTWVTEAETRLWYVDSGDEETAEFKRAEEPALRAKWEARAQQMLSDREFVARPNDKCRFCVRAKQNDGDCQFG